MCSARMSLPPSRWPSADVTPAPLAIPKCLQRMPQDQIVFKPQTATLQPVIRHPSTLKGNALVAEVLSSTMTSSSSTTNPFR